MPIPEKGMEPIFKSGYVGIIGKPNVGKSTLLNRLLGEKIAITSPKPQTTRTRILGVLTRPNSQMVFLDTPGIHAPKDKLHQMMISEIQEVSKDADLLLFLLEPGGHLDTDGQLALELLQKSRKKAIIVKNKMDLSINMNNWPELPEAMQKYTSISISALNGDGCDNLLALIEQELPEGPPYFPEDTLTDRSERFLIAELIREKAYHLFSDEIPYSVAVVTEEVVERNPELFYVRAVIYVEKDSQKGILIGQNGKALKRLGQDTRPEIEALLGRKVYLELWVKVKNNWRKDNNALRQLGME